MARSAWDAMPACARFRAAIKSRLLAMPWRCPACQTQIRHSPLEERPRLDTIYRCLICRLELVLDQKTDRLTLAPLHDGNADAKQRPT
jgi:predicted SprT family Zn-dependent metalloprotease